MGLRRWRYRFRLDLEMGCWLGELALSFWTGLRCFEDEIDTSEVQNYLKTLLKPSLILLMLMLGSSEGSACIRESESGGFEHGFIPYRIKKCGSCRRGRFLHDRASLKIKRLDSLSDYHMFRQEYG